MEMEIRPEIVSALDAEGRRLQRRGSRYRVGLGDRRLPVLELTKRGFTIEADRPPHLRGFVEIFEGDTRVACRLAVCAAARDGVVAYEFKRESPGAGERVPADHVAPAMAGLLAPPGA